MALEIYCDGACKPNPGVMGWAAVVVSGGEIVQEITGGGEKGTNNTAEMLAVLEGLKQVETEPADGKAVIYTDSALVHGMMVLGWRSTKPHLLRLRLMIGKVVRDLEWTVEYQKSGVGDQIFQLADALARQAVPQATMEAV